MARFASHSILFDVAEQSVRECNSERLRISFEQDLPDCDQKKKYRVSIVDLFQVFLHTTCKTTTFF